MRECIRAGCSAPGAWIPRLLVPAYGHPLVEGQRPTVPIYTNVTFCDEHRPTLVPAEVIVAGTSHIVHEFIATNGPGSPAPDFLRAELRWSALEQAPA